MLNAIYLGWSAVLDMDLFFFFEDVSIASSSISVAKTFLLSSLGYSLSFVGLRLVLKQVCQ